jgi:hypothetical protein
MNLQRAIAGSAQAYRSLLRLALASQVIAALLLPTLTLPACAQGAGLGAGANTPINIPRTNQTPTTILPTDVLPLPAAQERMSFGENLQLRVLQRLPAKFYFNSSVETSFRYETNVFQFPHKRQLLEKLIPPSVGNNGQSISSRGFESPIFGYGQFVTTAAGTSFQQLPFQTQQQLSGTMALASRDDTIFRALPNVTVGWAFTPRTRVFGNYFLIRDSLFGNVRLNTVIQSVAYGIQQDIPITRKGNLQLEFQARELFQLKQQPVFDFLPAATFSYILTPRTVVFVNTLLQMRGKKYFQAPTRELDPFYTFGMLYQRGGWSLSSTATFVQNFREPFRRNASTPQNNYSWIMDFEIARRLMRELPGLQAFLRAEPIYNFHSGQAPGLAGQDFRLFYGLRMALGKPPLTAALEQIRQQLEEQETAPPGPNQPPGKSPGEPKPSAYLMPYQVTASNPQPIHGTLPVSYTRETASAATGPNWILPRRRTVAPPPTIASKPAEPPHVVHTAPPAKKKQRSKPSITKLIASKPAAPKADKKDAQAKQALAKQIAAKEAAAKELAAKEATALELAAKEAAKQHAASQTASKEIAKQLAAKEAATKEVAKQLVAKEAATKAAQAKQIVAKKSSELQMILMAPLPTVHPDDKENPFGGTGIDIMPPVMVVR